jgi:hypothetical protein
MVLMTALVLLITAAAALRVPIPEASVGELEDACELSGFALGSRIYERLRAARVQGRTLLELKESDMARIGLAEGEIQSLQAALARFLEATGAKEAPRVVPQEVEQHDVIQVVEEEAPLGVNVHPAEAVGLAAPALVTTHHHDRVQVSSGVGGQLNGPKPTDELGNAPSSETSGSITASILNFRKPPARAMHWGDGLFFFAFLVALVACPSGFVGDVIWGGVLVAGSLQYWWILTVAWVMLLNRLCTMVLLFVRAAWALSVCLWQRIVQGVDSPFTRTITTMNLVTQGISNGTRVCFSILALVVLSVPQRFLPFSSPAITIFGFNLFVPLAYLLADLSWKTVNSNLSFAIFALAVFPIPPKFSLPAIFGFNLLAPSLALLLALFWDLNANRGLNQGHLWADLREAAKRALILLLGLSLALGPALCYNSVYPNHFVGPFEGRPDAPLASWDESSEAFKFTSVYTWELLHRRHYLPFFHSVLNSPSTREGLRPPFLCLLGGEALGFNMTWIHVARDGGKVDIEMDAFVFPAVQDRRYAGQSGPCAETMEFESSTVSLPYADGFSAKLRIHETWNSEQQFQRAALSIDSPIAVWPKAKDALKRSVVESLTLSSMWTLITSYSTGAFASVTSVRSSEHIQIDMRGAVIDGGGRLPATWVFRRGKPLPDARTIAASTSLHWVTATSIG